jgi:uncharacterized RDD family membrane protein YckC
MRCPKCHYVSFDGQNRCRNCGYDLSLSQLANADTLELPTNTESTATPLADLSLKSDTPSGTDTPTLVDRYMPPQPASAGSARTAAARAAAPGGSAGSESDPLDLPLFGAPANAPPRSAGVAAARSAMAPTEASAASPSPHRVVAGTRSAMPQGDDAAAPTAPMRAPARGPADDRPLVSGATPPRAPLAVRRPTGEGPRARRVTPSVTPTRIEEPRLDLGIPEPAGAPNLDEIDLSAPLPPRDVAANIAASRAAAARTALPVETLARQAAVRDAAPREALVPETPVRATVSADVDVDDGIDPHLAPIGTRVLAGAIDLLFMLAVDAVVVYFTLRVTGLPLAAWRRLPLAPLAGFLALLHGGYLTMFIAASGQTMGKMLTHVRVVAAQGGPVPFGSAVVRAGVQLLTITPAGVGFIPALLGGDRRALHDRFADTKVITTTD